jgi:hypothetical protein
VLRTFKGVSKEQTTTFDTPPDAVLFDSDLSGLALISQALGLYDHSGGGVQKFSLLIGGRPPLELTLDVKEKAVRDVGHRKLALTKYLYGIPGLDIYAWADEACKIYVIPAQSVLIVRSRAFPQVNEEARAAYSE